MCEIAVRHCYFGPSPKGTVVTLLNRKVDYALLILAYLSQKAEGGCAREVAGRFGLSRAFVANILKELCHKGFVSSHRGVKGGYLLRRSPETVSLAELMDALDESFRFAECTQRQPGDGCSLVNVCPIKDRIAEVHRRLRQVLEDITLAELFGPAVPATDLQIGLEPLAGARAYAAALGD
jgi:Rrf2 family cysteine metabolism transcriptional repressor